VINMCIDTYEYARGPSRSVAPRIVTDSLSVAEAGSMPTFDYQGFNVNLDSMFSNMSFNVDLGITADMMTESKVRPSAKDQWTTTTTTVVTPGNNKKEQAANVKMVADELLGATGTVVGFTLGLFGGSPFLGAESGEAVGRNLGDAMYSAAHWWHDPSMFSASDRTNRRMKQDDWRVG
jgi:hypothetical protein